MESSVSGIFVGRESEINLLRSTLEHARTGNGRLVLLQGEAGMGKTRLCEEAASRARENNVRVLWGRGYEEAGAPAFWPWVQVLRAAVKQLDSAGRASVDVDALAPLLPEIGNQIGDRQFLPTSESPEARFRLFEASVQLLATLAQGAPLLIVLDDLQGVDRSSLLLLEFVTRALRELPIQIVGTHRDVSRYPEHPLTHTMVDLAREPATVRLVLSGLSESEVATLVEASVGFAPPAAFVTQLHQRTEGNPLFVGEFVRVLLRQSDRSAICALQPADVLAVPPTVRAVIERRLGRLSAVCRATLQMAALLGRDFELHLLTAVTMIGAGSDAAQEGATARALEEAAEAGIVGLQPDAPRRYRFAHALIQETLSDGLPLAQRAQLHRQVGEAMEQLSDAGEHLAELAHHFSEAGLGQQQKAIHYARRAGDRAMAMLAYEEAVRQYQLVLDLLRQSGVGNDADRCGVLVDLGVAQHEAGDLETSKATLQRGAELAQRTGQREQLARAALHFGTKVEWGEQMAPDHTLLQLLDSAAAAWEETDSPLHARVLARLALALRFSAEQERRLYVSRLALEMARRLDDPALIAETVHAYLAAHFRPDNLDERMALADEMAYRAEQSRAVDLVFLAASWRGVTVMESGLISQAMVFQDQCERLLAPFRDPLHRWWAAIARAGRSILEGRFSELDELVQQSLVLEQAVNNGPPFGSFAMMVTLWFAQGRRDSLETLLESQRAILPSVSPLLRQSLIASTARELNRPVEARTEFEQAAAREFQDVPYDETWLTLMQRFAEVCAFLEDRPRAARLIELLNEYEDRVVISPVTNMYLGPVSESLALLETTLSRWDDATAHFERTLERHREVGSRPALARTQYEYARMLLARAQATDQARADVLLAEAGTTAGELEMPLLLERVQALQAKTVRSSNAASADATAAPDPAPASSDRIFHHAADYWTVAYAGTVVRLKDSKGMRYLAHLLRQPGQECLALDLIVQHQSPSTHARAETFGDGLPLLDAKAKAAYRTQLAELRDELQEAEAANDTGRAEHVRVQIEFIGRELAAAVGLGGTDRTTGSAAERARSTVTKGIKSAIAKIRTVHPSAGRYLARTIRTGYFCVFQPDPEDPASWVL